MLTKKVDVDAIVHAYQNEGKSLEEVGAQFGVSFCTVRDRLKKRGIARRAPGSRSKVDRTRLVELRAAGLSHSELAFIFGVSRTTIQDRLQQLGLGGALS